MTDVPTFYESRYQAGRRVAFSRPVDRMPPQQIMAQPLPLRIGTRGSPMALVQARIVRDRLATAHAELAAPGALEIVVVRTTGDRVQDRPLHEIGGHGPFTKGIQEGPIPRTVALA